MVKPFHLARTPLIFFGAGKVKMLPGAVKSFGSHVALVTGKRSFLASKCGNDILKVFSDNGITYDHVIIPGEPSPEMIDNAVVMLRSNPANAVVSIGGGSVIDAGKAISAMMYVPGSVREYLEVIGSGDHPGIKMPFIALPTTSGTGSEATKNAVISQTGKNGFKRSLRHDNFVPDIAIIDPELTLNCPPEITAAGGLDCFTQLVESFLSDRASEYTDALAIEGLKAIKQSLLRSFSHGEDIEARQDMSFAALMSGICLANAGLGVVHGLAGTIGGMFDIPHGVICGSLMAPANGINVRELRKNFGTSDVLKKYEVLGRIFLEAEHGSEDYYIDGFIDYLYNIADELCLPDLGRFGILHDDVSGICLESDLKNNPVKLSSDNLEELVNSRL